MTWAAGASATRAANGFALKAGKRSASWWRSGADLQCRMGTGCVAGRRLVSLRSARLGVLLSRRCANTVALFLGLHNWRRFHAAWSWLVSGWGRGLRSFAAPPHPCGSTIVGPTLLIRARIVRAALGPVLRWSFPSMCGPSGPQGIVQSRRHPCRLGSRCVPPLGRRHPCRRPSVPDGNGLLCKMRLWRSIAHATHPFAPARATVGRSSSRGRTPRERWCLRVTRAGMDAGGFAKPAGRRPAITKPIPRRNFHWRAGRKPAGLSGVGLASVEPQGCGDAPTKPQAAHQPKELLKTSRMDAATAPQPPTTHPVFAHLLRTTPTAFPPLADESSQRPFEAGHKSASFGVPVVSQPPSCRSTR